VRSPALKLAIAYVALGLAALMLFAVPLWYAWQVTVEAHRTDILHEDTQRLREVFVRDGVAGLRAFIDARVAMRIPNERILLFTDPSLHPLAGNIGSWPESVPLALGTYSVTPLTFAGKRTSADVVHSALPGGYNLLVGRDLARFEPLEQHFWYGLLAATGVLCVAGVAGGLLLRRALMARIHSIRQAVSAVVRGNLYDRLPVASDGDELDTLSYTINGMFDQIEQLLHGVRNVSNAIAHDLRTPLAELRSRLEELSLTRPSSEMTYAEIDAALADVDRVIRIFDALLRLAEIDTGLRRAGFTRVDATALASAAVEFYVPAAELRGISLSYVQSGPAWVLGDPLLLAQAIGNLIDNALKYVPDRGHVVVQACSRADGAVEILVADDGPGIPEAEKPKVVERFYRGDQSRGTPGVGLGLSLVQAIAKLHGSALELLDNRPGLRARMVIPANGGAVPVSAPAGAGPTPRLRDSPAPA
jgi:signal transduction histidine kinase